MPQISVIVPVYKVEKYLKRCVDSILSQTFTDFELILVDDGSPDGCPQICDQYAQQDDRVYVIHQQNGGLSAARNAGIDWAFANSNSQWLTFVDSDDWIHPQTLEVLLKAARDNHVDVSICGFQKTNGEEVEVPSDWHIQLWRPEDLFVEHNENAIIACGKIFKKECFVNLRYPVGKLHEDAFIIYKILFQYAKVVYIDAPLYAYFQSPNSIMRASWTPARLAEIEARSEQITYFETHHFDHAKVQATKELLWVLIEQLVSIEILNNPENKKYVLYLRNLLRKQANLSLVDMDYLYTISHSISNERLGKKDICCLRKLLRHQIKKYKKRLGLSPAKMCYLYESAYPLGMKVYWLCLAVLRRFGFRKKKD